MASETASSRPALDLDQSVWLRQRGPLEKSDFALGVSADAFSQIFADMQATRPEQPRTRLREAPADMSTNGGPARLVVRECPANRAPDADKNDQSADAKDAGDKPQIREHAPKTAAKAEEKTKTKPADDTQTTDADSADTLQVSIANTTDTQTPVCDAPDTAANAAPQPDDGFKVALGVATGMQAAAETDTHEDESEKDGKEQAHAAHSTALESLLSFRANLGMGLPAAGKKPIAEAGSEKAAADFSTQTKTDLKVSATDAAPAPELEPVKTATKDAAPVQAPVSMGETPDGFQALMKDWAEVKTSEKPVSAAAPETFDAEAAPQVSQPPPAAGSRVNALTGFPAPAPTGSGGGSLPGAAQAAASGPHEVTGVTLAQGAPTGVETGAGLRLVRTAGLANMPPAEQVGAHLLRMVKSGIDRFDVQLHPADLGKVDIRLEINKEGLVRVSVTADNPAAYDMLQKDSRALERVLQQAGLQTDSGSLSFNLREDGQTQRQADDSQGNAPWKRWQDKILSNDAPVDTSAYTLAPGRVDFRV